MYYCRKRWSFVYGFAIFAWTLCHASQKLDKKTIAGIPVYNYDQMPLSAQSNSKSTWIVVMRDNVTDGQEHAVCAVAGQACIQEGRPSKGGLAYLTLETTEADLEQIVARGADKGSYAFIEPSLPTEAATALEVDNSRYERPASKNLATDVWGLDRIDAAKGCDGIFNPGGYGSGVNVYVLDTGVRTTHEDFGKRAFAAAECKENCTTCRTGDNTCARDKNGHGTHVAATIGGVKSGVAKSVQLHAVKVLDDDAKGSSSWTVAGIDWVIQNSKTPAVISASVQARSKSFALERVINKAVAAGILVVVAAGNHGQDACKYSPSFSASAITVGASNSKDEVWGSSNHGYCVDIFAPGVSVLSADFRGSNKYTRMSGTSMACPHVSGAAALLMEKYNFSNTSGYVSQIRRILQASSVYGVLSRVREWTPNLLLSVNEAHMNSSSKSCSAGSRRRAGGSRRRSPMTSRRRKSRRRSRRRRKS